MRWSKLKQTIEDKFADCVKGRVEIFCTVYNKPNSSTGRGWMTIDGQEIANFSTIKSAANFGYFFHEATPTACMKHPAVKEEDRTPGLVTEEGEFSRYDLCECCFAYLNMTVEQGLAHNSPLINVLAVLDKRLGKRRLPLLKDQKLHPLVQKMLDLRLDAEGLRVLGFH
jgi:hypothetical protein